MSYDRGVFRRASLVLVVVSAGVAGTVVSCSSLPDLTFDDVGDGGGAEGAAGDGGVGASCTCQAVPAGWTPVMFSTSSRRSCPDGTNESDLRVTSGDGTPRCSCSCSDVGGSCRSGNFTFTLTGEATCGVGATTASIPVDVGSCSALASPINLPAVAFAKVAHTGPTSCSPKASVTSQLSGGRVCQAPPSAACGADQVCVPRPANGFDSCITKSGIDACPVGFPGRSTAGTSADSSKACLGCACGTPGACTGGSVSVYDGSMCKTTGQSHGATGIGTTCAATSDSSFTGTHFRSTPPTGGCGTTPTTPPTPGTIAFADARTICCK